MFVMIFVLYILFARHVKKDHYVHDEHPDKTVSGHEPQMHYAGDEKVPLLRAPPPHSRVHTHARARMRATPSVHHAPPPRPAVNPHPPSRTPLSLRPC